MPRPAWLAVGTATGALALGAISPLAVVLFAVCGLVGSLAAYAGRVGEAFGSFREKLEERLASRSSEELALMEKARGIAEQTMVKVRAAMKLV